MDFESPDVAKDFPGLFASENMKRSQSHNSDYSDDEKTSRKDLLGKKKDKKESKKDKGYMVFEGESSEDEVDEARSPSKCKKNKSSAFKFPGKDKKDKSSKSKDKESKDRKDEKEKVCKKESKEGRKDSKEVEKIQLKKKKENKLLKIKDKKKKIVDQDVKEEKPIFGVPLHIAVERNKSYDGIELPVIVRECIDYIEDHGLSCEGIYKISGLKSKVRNLKQQYNTSQKVYLYEHEPHIIASLLKQFLRELPEPILTTALSSKFEEACAIKSEQKKRETFQKLLNELPNCNRLLLSWIFIHMQNVIALERRNKMNLQNVSIALSPTLQMSHNVMQTFFQYASFLFKGVELKKYVPPIELDSTRLSLELPDSPSAIAEELSKQENILNILHAELNTGLRDQQKEEKLWEIQRVVTQLKRKLRFLRQLEDSSNAEMNDAPPTDELVVSNNIILTKDAPSNQNPLPSIALLPTDGKLSAPSDVDKRPNVEVESSKVLDNDDVECSKQTQLVEDKSGILMENIQPSVNKEKECSLDNVGLNDTENTPAALVSHIEVKQETEIETSLAPESCVDDLEKESKDENLSSLRDEEKMLRIQNEELILLGDELRRKINAEKFEIDRLKMEINEYQQLYKYKRYAFDSTENSSSESDDSSASECEDEEEDLSTVLDGLIKKNKELECLNREATKTIQCEREVCLNIKVHMKMLQIV